MKKLTGLDEQVAKDENRKSYRAMQGIKSVFTPLKEEEASPFDFST